jgi:DNA-binding transcriptional LysR family regulator
VAPWDDVDLDLAQVRAFVAVVDHGHFGRAAESLNLTQQALSKRVARLERELGPLLERRRGGVELTAAGERFLPAARRMLEVADRAVADVRGTPAAPLRVDVWGELHPPARLVRAVAREQPELTVELSMRRDLVQAVGALERHELDLAFGNAANLDDELPGEMSAELVTTDPLAVLVNARGPLAARDHATPDDVARQRIWWPTAGSSPELRAFAEEYARSIGATLTTEGSNLGLDALIERVAGDVDVVAPVAAAWPLTGHDGVRVVPLRPTPHYPWYAVWRTAVQHPSLPRLLRAVRRAAPTPELPAGATWLPRGALPSGIARDDGPPRR